MSGAPTNDRLAELLAWNLNAAREEEKRSAPTRRGVRGLADARIGISGSASISTRASPTQRFTTTSKPRVDRVHNLRPPRGIPLHMKHWSGLTCFLDDGHVELDTNIVGRPIRSIAIGKRNSLFADGEGGGSSVGPTHGDQELSCTGGHYECACYHPLFPYNVSGVRFTPSIWRWDRRV